MPYLRDYDWKSKYDADTESLVADFYDPALLCAERYDRSTGFFSAGALTLAARGIEGLVRNNGTMRLVVGCTIEQPVAEAIQHGIELRGAVEMQYRVMPLDPQHPEESDALELLAWMIGRGHLEVKLAIPCNSARVAIATAGIFHEKAGVIEDRRGDRLAFNGSINETYTAWSGTNWESFHAFTDWDSRKHVDDEDRSFGELWNQKKKHCLVIDLPDALKNDLLRFLPANDQQVPKRLIDQLIQPAAPSAVAPGESGPTVDDLRREIWRFVAAAPRLPNGGCYVGEKTSIVEPWPHQVRAFHRMYDQWPPRLLIADEVGLGKTIEAGLAIRQAILAGRAKRILVLAPKAVLTQWQVELREKFNLNWPIYDGKAFLPYETANPQPERKVSRDEWHREAYVIASSQLMRRTDRIAELLAAEPWDLVLLDEAHHARRRGFGPGSRGPNQLLGMMQRLKVKTQGLLLLTATPMQVDPREVWDLLNLLGLPPSWTEDAFVEFFERANRPNLAHADFESMVRLFRASEAQYGLVDAARAVRFIDNKSALRARKVLAALRDSAELPRKQMSPTDRNAALKIMLAHTPVSRLVSRHTRDLLRRYVKAGKIHSRIAERDVVDRFVPLTPSERAVYEKVETYISTTYDQASAKEKNAIGFVMTIYRRRLASSFSALSSTLRNRLEGIEKGKFQASAEDVDGSELFDDQIDDDEATRLEREALELEEKIDIADLIDDISQLPTDTKAQWLIDEIRALREGDYHQVIVFTQYTDTVDFLRDLLVDQLGVSVLCYSGRGGEIRDNDGHWRRVSRDAAKAKFRRGEADILLATDAAAEGLNFQFCGALVNYDMPWNPMKVEQRIGRIDRLGQEFEKIRIINLHYSDTVETDVYLALRQRIQLFSRFIGKLQPILSKVPMQIRQAVLKGPAAGHEQERRLEIDAQIREEQLRAEAQGFDLDEITESDFEDVNRPDAPYSLDDLKRLVTIPELLPTSIEIRDLTLKYATLVMAGMLPTRITTDAEFFDEHPQSSELWSPGSQTFPSPETVDESYEPPVRGLRELLDRFEKEQVTVFHE